MKAVKGIYNGNTVKVLEPVDAKPNARVVVTFLDEEASKDAMDDFLSACGGWEDDRSPEKIIQEIYALRSVSTRPEPNL